MARDAVFNQLPPPWGRVVQEPMPSPADPNLPLRRIQCCSHHLGPCASSILASVLLELPLQKHAALSRRWHSHAGHLLGKSLGLAGDIPFMFIHLHQRPGCLPPRLLRWMKRLVRIVRPNLVLYKVVTV